MKGSRLLYFIRVETELPTIEEWIKKNRKTIEALHEVTPKIHSALSAAIGRHRNGIIERIERLD